MTDTPAHIKALQLKIWLAKSPGERLLRAIQDNEVLFLAWKEAKEKLAQQAPLNKHSEESR